MSDFVEKMSKNVHRPHVVSGLRPPKKREREGGGEKEREGGKRGREREHGRRCVQRERELSRVISSAVSSSDFLHLRNQRRTKGSQRREKQCKRSWCWGRLSGKERLEMFILGSYPTSWYEHTHIERERERERVRERERESESEREREKVISSFM